MVKPIEIGKKKQKKMNLEKKRCDVCIDIVFVYLKWASAMWCIGISLFLINAWCWQYLKQKNNLEHLSKQFVDDISCWYMWDFLPLPKCLSILVVKCLQDKLA